MNNNEGENVEQSIAELLGVSSGHELVEQIAAKAEQFRALTNDGPGDENIDLVEAAQLLNWLAFATGLLLEATVAQITEMDRQADGQN